LGDNTVDDEGAAVTASPRRTSEPERPVAQRRGLAPLFAAGFTTAFGAHGIAANLGGFTTSQHASLLVLGGLLALYDGAEVILKPVFGTLADRIGARRVLVGGLLLFAAASAVFAVVHDTGWLWLARLGQGAGAAAFSPAASALVARLTPEQGRGRAFGSYGFYKSIGYTLGPLLGGAVVAAAGLGLLFTVMTVMAVTVAGWALLAVPPIAPARRRRQTLLDTARRLVDRTFLTPTVTLAAATAALSAGVGFLPVAGHAAHWGPAATGAAVSALALSAALTQPWAGRALDTGKLTTGAGITAGLTLTALGLAAAALPTPAGILTAAITIGAGTGVITPLAFTSLARSTPEEHLGQTMGAAEIGRECGDLTGPLVVAAVATTVGLAGGFLALAAVTSLVIAFVAWSRPDARQDRGRAR
jgi:MFS family permease